MSILDLLKKRTEPPKEAPVGSYSVQVVSLPEELDWDECLPIELRYVFKKLPEAKERLRAMLASGKAIGVRTVERTPERVLEAVKHVSFHSQHNCILTWLPELLRDKHLCRSSRRKITRAPRSTAPTSTPTCAPSSTRASPSRSSSSSTRRTSGSPTRTAA